MAVTPQLRSSGYFEFKLPWKAQSGVVYECLAIRSFDELTKSGINVYKAFYLPMGMTNGLKIDGGVFDFTAETMLKPNIITLRGSDGSYINIPDTFIAKVPDASYVPYSEVVLAISLGPLPDDLNIDSLKDDIKALVAARANINPEVETCRASVAKNPSLIEHIELEKTRLGKTKSIRPNTQMLLDLAKKDIGIRDTQIKTLLDVLDAHDLLGKI